MFPSFKRYDHCTYCTVSPKVSTTFLSWLMEGITVTYTRSNGDRVLATVISVSKCGQYVSIEYDVKGHCVSHPMAPHQPPRISANHSEATRKE